MHECAYPGCDYSAKTAGAVTQHTNREHSADPLAALRNTIPGAPRPGGVQQLRQLTAAPSGIPSIDYAIGIGGLPRGCLVEIFGPSQSGKTFVALTFSAHAQGSGGRAGFMDAERALQESFLELIPGLDPVALEYGMPPEPPEDADAATVKKMLEAGWDGSGEAALEASRNYIATGLFDVWTIDSVAALVPRQELGKPVNATAAQAAQAKLMRAACRVMENEISKTNTCCIFINHVTAIPAATRGRDWSKPGGGGLDYYASVQMKVETGRSFVDSKKRKIGHEVRIRIHKSKVAQPYAVAEFDLYYGEGRVGGDDDGRPIRDVVPGVDLTTSWFSVLKESQTIKAAGGVYFDVNGEAIGKRQDVLDALEDPLSSLSVMARDVVYPEQYRKVVA
jgi:recombination protein RecA